MVPDWRLISSSVTGPGSRLALAFTAVWVAYHWRLLPVLTDWVSFAVDEGYTTYAAQRIREGDIPHRDFFFLWTPGTAYLHALLQALGAGWLQERAAAMLASGFSAVLVLRASRLYLGARDRLLLALLLLAWGYALWNIPYSSWYAVPLALAAAMAFPRFPLLGGVLFALAFWFKQNVGILAFLGAAGWLMGTGAAKRSLLRLAGGFLPVLLLPFLAFLIFGGSDALLQAIRQIFLFPLRYPALMGTSPPARIFAAPLTVLGLWLLSLFFFRGRAGNRTVSLLQFGLVVYIAVQAWPAPREFALGLFLLLSVIAWPFALVAETSRGDREGLRRLLCFLLPAFGAFLQVAPRLDFQHFLFVFPLSALMLMSALRVLLERYPFLGALWVRLPVFLLLAGGAFLQAGVLHSLRTGKVDSLGVISRDLPMRLDMEVAAVKSHLLSLGLPEGGPLLVLPNATSFYRWTGFRNPTPHQQFFPGYVEAYGASQEEVLAVYRARKGRFLVVQERSGLRENVPRIAEEIERDYKLVKAFPEYFTLYEPKALSRAP